ncbi:MAG: hypothetical protein EOP11_06280 [Proteobacteria bacterium]|nr:MAG: hypothetical protein EOP11_06280 [Pseudomonadota bacterium]
MSPQKPLASTKISKVLIAFAGFHFALLAAGMLRLDIPQDQGLWWQRIYARVTGAGGSFGFFSPNVPREFGLSFEVENADGKVTTARLTDYSSEEVQSRVTNMVHLIASNFNDKKMLRSLAASFTAAMFRENPEAKSIRVLVDFYAFPTIGGYAQGQRTELKRVYSAKFRKGTTTI